VLANFAHLADNADGALILCVVLGAVKCAFFVAGTAVDWRVASRADLKLGKLIKFNLHRVVRVTLALSLSLSSLLAV